MQRGHTEFGVVLAGEKGIVNTGCTATVEKVLKNYPDGRMDLITIGRRRFEIILLNDEKPYLRGAVEYFDDEATDPIPPEVRKRVIDSYNDIRALDEPEPLHEPELSDPQLSFQLAQVVPDLDFRQILLATRSEADRMRRLAEFFPSYSFAAAPDPARARGGAHQRARQGACRRVSIDRTTKSDRRRRRHAVGEQYLLRARVRRFLRFSGALQPVAG